MATNVFNYANKVQSFTDFQSIFKPLCDFMTTIGWVQAADSGQLNWATATGYGDHWTTIVGNIVTPWLFRGAYDGLTAYAIGDIVTSAGQTYYCKAATTGNAPPNTTYWVPWNFQIWRTNDGITPNLYIRIEMGLNAAATPHPELIITVGTGSDGNGNLITSGPQSNRNMVFPQATSTVGSTTAYENDLSGGTNWICIAYYRTATGGFFGLDRSRDSNGNTTNQYAFLVTNIAGISNISTSQVLLLNPTAGALPVETFLPAAVTSQTTGTLGASTTWSPIFPVVGKLDNELLCGIVKPNDVVEGGIVPVLVFGATHYYMCGKFSRFIPNVSNSTAIACFMWRFE